MFSFLSIEFALFFIAFFCIYWLFRAQPKIQNLLLLLISYLIIYLMAGSLAVMILFAFSCFIYLCSLAIDQFANYKKSILIFAILVTVFQLSVFKYYDFFKPIISQSLALMRLDSSGLLANLILPLGISYYSFQAISYLVGRYRQQIDCPAFNFSDILLHFGFFMTISAGPIARAQQAKGLNDIQAQPCAMSAQIIDPQPRKILLPSVALLLIVLALIKKWWLAGWLADQWVNPVFANPLQYHSLEVLAAIYGYTLQLFLDFSGYSEMMIAFGLLLGFRLPVNFKAPLLAHNIRDFWERWHISLSTWIRDHIYIPLGGSRHGFGRTQFNLLSAMVLSGIWHGSTWNFFIWGLLHGLGLVVLNSSDKLYQQLTAVEDKQARNAFSRSSGFAKCLSVLLTISFVSLCFVFFRAKSLEEAMNVFRALFSNYINVPWISNPLYLLGLFGLVWAVYPCLYKVFNWLVANLDRCPKWLLSLVFFLLFMLVMICAPSGIPGFIYANF